MPGRGNQLVAFVTKFLKRNIKTFFTIERCGWELAVHLFPSLICFLQQNFNFHISLDTLICDAKCSCPVNSWELCFAGTVLQLDFVFLLQYFVNAYFNLYIICQSYHNLRYPRLCINSCTVSDFREEELRISACIEACFSWRWQNWRLSCSATDSDGGAHD